MSNNKSKLTFEPAEERLKINSEHKLRSENLAFDIDVWYPSLKQFTFPTIFLPLKRTESQAMINFYRTVNDLLRDHEFCTYDVWTLQALENRIAEALKNNAEYFRNGAFVRLCGRSPKDSCPIDPKKFIQQYWTQLSEENEESFTSEEIEAEPSFNKKLRLISSIPWMKVTSGREALSLILTSERCSIDFIDWMKYGEPEQIVLRSWEPRMTMENEFRAFVYKGCLNAISQYDHYCVYPNLANNPRRQEKIKQEIAAFWKKVHPAVGEESYVIDFAYFDLQNNNSNEEPIKVIEISPFLPCTGAAMFSWKSDEKILRREEQGEIELRVLKEFRLEVEKLIVPNWEERWKVEGKHFQLPFDSFYDKAIDCETPPYRAHTPRVSQTNYISNFTRTFSILWTTNAILCVISMGMSPSAWAAVITERQLYFNALFISAFLTAIRSLIAKIYRKAEPDPDRTLIFFYGTLRKGYHWNKKFLSFGSDLISPATTLKPMVLVVGESGVPYVLKEGDKSKAQPIRGELWSVDSETLQNLDEYEGVSKEYYCRELITVKDSNNTNVQAWIYMKKGSMDNAPAPIAEYDLDMHQKLYRPVRHIQVKQEAYLGLEKNRH